MDLGRPLARLKPCTIFCYRANLSASTLILLATSWEQTSRPVSSAGPWEAWVAAKEDNPLSFHPEKMPSAAAQLGPSSLVSMLVWTFTSMRF